MEVSSHKYPPEFSLALASARWPLREGDVAEIRALADLCLDWEWFKRIVERNQIVPLVYQNLHKTLSDFSHSKILKSLRDSALGQTRYGMSQAAELVRVSESIGRAGLEMLALKGLTLSVIAYGNLTMRSTGDIDLLVPPTQVLEVERVLVSLGYKRFEPGAKLTPRRMQHYLRYYKHFIYVSEKGMPLELHWRLFLNTPILKGEDTRFPRTMSVTVGPGAVSTLNRNELFLYLCAHGAIHGWPILKWLADIGALLGVMTAENLADIVAQADELGLMAELRSALILVDLFLAIERPTADLPSEADRTVERIVTMAQRLLTAKNYCLEIHRLPRFGMFFYDLRLRSSWRYRSEDIRRALVFPDDWELIDLPDALFPLYTAVRPVSWLMRHLPRPMRRQPSPDGR
jgi:hypothetical protein